MYAGPTHNPNLFCRAAIYGGRALHPLTVKRRPTVNKTELLNKLSRDGDERLLLARAMDKLELARTRNIPACTGFLSPQERASVENLLSASGHPAHLFYGGYEGAERTVCAFLPDWLEGADWAADPDSCPVRAIRCTWSGVSLSHRGFRGASLGRGLYK